MLITDSSVMGEVLVGHTDAVWSLSYCGTRQQLLSASADMTIKLWNPMNSDPLLQTLQSDGEWAIVARRSNGSHLV